ncbi:ABC transporter ATP-binding protein [Sphingobacteriaceae bacterium WQ 2009]|uniref:ABC transporter ATP-binding protein n=1 Tax=Rhinopithecimicrobium faecis TaxID=2820698 RepID=A0A8T4H8R9_9SPHI|nr:ABC transporter ATP-binding protein [Sphingobacteriaceae bacterium WQ 2009]
MKIDLQNIGRRFNREWIFRAVNYRFEAGKCYAILGPNGSGKSTLLKVIVGNLTPSEGSITYENTQGTIAVEDIFAQTAIATPYVELIEEFTLREQIQFHFKFKNYLPGFSENSILEILGLKQALDKPIRFFSSGMKQRVKLVLACCSDATIVLLDEPTSNLDLAGEAWYLALIERTRSPQRIFIICSNQPKEYSFCEHQINVIDFKK